MTQFDQQIDRTGTNSIKWAVKPGELPMWIADMDFKTAPAIIAAMTKKVQFGVFGYEEPPAAYFTAVADWYAQQHGARPEPAWMLYCTGVIPAVSSLVRRLSHPGDNVVVQAPVYNMFYHSIENNGRHTLSSDLVYDAAAGRYHIDWADLEQKLAAPLSTLMILCNPHNPIGKAWSKAELTHIATLCLKHHVVLLSDEIHGDLVFGAPAYTPVFALPQPLRDNAVICVSPSKTFNVAALHAATVIVPGQALRDSATRALNNDELAEPNLLSLPGSIAAYTQGAAWLAALKQVLAANRAHVQDFLAAKVPQIRPAFENATYLLWLDISALGTTSDAFCAFLREHTGLILSAGGEYRGNGAQFIRMNIACPAAMLDDGLARLARGTQLFLEQNQ
ncbi:MalY/PatB family protein [Lacticaseibacillus jixianensis]|uniref:cysteine-S-conjugate beta-lyase n=1 Tax=Lacticaseibacillus jixianensis TaxID=2486012 RepID=A0ABW4B5A0_9LACO|nr:MalY/PatB family protein [Lacticaseibacillus jixianensis]